MPLDHKTCQALKEKGFPQDTHYAWEYDPWLREWVVSTEVQRRLRDLQYGSRPAPHPTEPLVACPTLEDLIRELGDDFFSLERTHTHKRENRKVIWVGNDPLGEHGVGDTPEQALANLYLSR